jgi:hypothetical protein
MALKPQMDYQGPDMPQGAGPQAAPGAASQDAAAPTPDQQGKGNMGPKDVLSAIKTIESAMMAIASSLEKAGAPQEAVAALGDAIKSYGQFVSALTGQPSEAPQAPEAKAPVAGPAPMETAGSKGNVGPAQGMMS